MISIIVPIYNTEKYLCKCIESILAQTYEDFELLLVDDGSTDNSGNICEEYAKKDSRIRLFHKKNEGVSSARNIGLENAKGDWVCFVDSDDTVAENYLEMLLKAAIENEADSSMGGFRYIKTEKTVEIVPASKGIETTEENINGFYACVAPDWQRYLWNRLLKADVIQKNNLRFNEKIFYKEDGLFLIQFLCASNGKVGCCIEIIYNYRQHLESAIGGLYESFTPKLLTNAKAHNLIVKTLKKNSMSDSVLSRAKRHAKFSTEWIKDIMRRSGKSCLSYNLKLDFLLFDTLGFVEFSHYKIPLIARSIYQKAKNMLWSS